MKQINRIIYNIYEDGCYEWAEKFNKIYENFKFPPELMKYRPDISPKRISYIISAEEFKSLSFKKGIQSNGDLFLVLFCNRNRVEPSDNLEKIKEIANDKKINKVIRVYVDEKYQFNNVIHFFKPLSEIFEIDTHQLLLYEKYHNNCILERIYDKLVKYIANINIISLIKYNVDINLSSSKKKVFFLVLALLFVWWLSAYCILKYWLPETAAFNEMSPQGFSYMLITDPGTVLDSFKTQIDCDGTTKSLDLLDVFVLCLFSAIGVVLFSGLMISVFSNLIQRRVDDIKDGISRYQHLRNHIVIIGYDDLLPILVAQICKNRDFCKTKILIQTKQDCNEVREVLNSVLDKEQLKRVIIYSGRRDSKEELYLLNLVKAKHLFVLGNRKNLGHDALNVDCLTKISEILKVEEKKRSNVIKMGDIPVSVMFDNHSTYTAFQVADISKEWRKYFKFIPFNFYDNWAQQVIVHQDYDGPYDEEDIDYPRIEGRSPLRGTMDTVHIVIFGFTSMAVAIATQAAHYLHFSRKSNHAYRKSRITFICEDAHKEMEIFYSRYNNLFEIQSSYYRDYMNGNGKIEIIKPLYFKGEKANFLDIRFEFINGQSYTKGVRDLISKWADDKSQRLSFFISTGTERNDINIGLSLPDIIYSKGKPVFIHQKHSGELIHLLQKSKNLKYKEVYPFGMIDTQLDLNQDKQLKGMLVNYFYCHGQKFDNDLECIEPIAKSQWSTIRTSDQWSSIFLANSFELKLKEMGLSGNKGKGDKIIFNRKEAEKVFQTNINELCEIEQNRWNVEKLLLGYKKPHDKEQLEIDKNREIGNSLFKQLKNEKLIHDYIRSYSELSTIKWKGMSIPKDNVQDINKSLLLSIPQIEEYIKKTNNTRNEKVYPLPN